MIAKRELCLSAKRLMPFSTGRQGTLSDVAKCLGIRAGNLQYINATKEIILDFVSGSENIADLRKVKLPHAIDKRLQATDPVVDNTEPSDTVLLTSVGGRRP